MAQHFLLSAASRTTSLLKIAKMTERQCENYFRKLRWADTGGNPVCSHCGSTEHYKLSTRKVWKCKNCHNQFTVSSGTIFASHKLPYKTVLMAMTLYANAAKGISAAQLSREIDVQYKTAWVLLGKFREALMEARDETPMNGVIEMDGCYVGNYVRPANNVDERIDRRLTVNQNPNKCCIINLRQLSDEPHAGAVRTLTFVARTESSAAISSIVSRYILPTAVIHADEASGYDVLHARNEMRRINHSQGAYSNNNACTNQAESYNSRLRRMEIGVIHRLTGKYVQDYANEIAYREDNRKKSNGGLLEDIARKFIKSEKSGEWAGYWQGNHRVGEHLVA